MLNVYLHFLLSAVTIVVAGVFLAHASDKIAEITGMGRLLAGSILLAGATSMPELLVDVSAIRQNMPDLAVGDLLGSSLFNLLILAIADLFHKSQSKMLSRAGAQHALSASLSINLTALAAGTILLSGMMSYFDILDVGPGPMVIAGVFLLGTRVVYVDQQKIGLPQNKAAGKNSSRQIAKAASLYISSALVILLAAPYLAASAGKIADETGLGGTFVGTTLVAFCTSLPEVVATITAMKMGAFDLAVGNIFGSNSFNMVLLVPLDWFYKGNLLASVSPAHVVTALATILATSVAVMGQLYHEDKRKKFLEPDAATVILIVLLALFILRKIGALPV